MNQPSIPKCRTCRVFIVVALTLFLFCVVFAFFAATQTVSIALAVAAIVLLGNIAFILCNHHPE
jgi:membrane protein YdbS with pleckstrin-like domain